MPEALMQPYQGGLTALLMLAGCSQLVLLMAQCRLLCRLLMATTAVC
jgi:hypothetical protein